MLPCPLATQVLVHLFIHHICLCQTCQGQGAQCGGEGRYVVTEHIVNAARDMSWEYGCWELVQKSFLLDRKMKRVERQGCSLPEAQTAARAWGTRGCEEGLKLEGAVGNEHNA